MRVDSHLRVKTTKVLSDVFFFFTLIGSGGQKKSFFFYIFLAANFSCRQFPTRTLRTKVEGVHREIRKIKFTVILQRTEYLGQKQFPFVLHYFSQFFILRHRENLGAPSFFLFFKMKGICPEITKT